MNVDARGHRHLFASSQGRVKENGSDYSSTAARPGTDGQRLVPQASPGGSYRS